MQNLDDCCEKRLSFKITIRLNNHETANVSLRVVGVLANVSVTIESSTPSRSQEADPEPDVYCGSKAASPQVSLSCAY